MKAILIIDINDELLEDYEYFYVDYDLRAERKNENYTESIKFVEDCPLKSLPERKYAIQGMKGYSSTLKKCEGWNECLDEILGVEQ